jgi:hypothetical protein
VHVPESIARTCYINLRIAASRSRFLGRLPHPLSQSTAVTLTSPLIATND